MHYKSLCSVMVAVLTLSLVVPNVAMAANLPAAVSTENSSNQEVSESTSDNVQDKPETESEQQPSESNGSETTNPSETPPTSDSSDGTETPPTDTTDSDATEPGTGGTEESEPITTPSTEPGTEKPTEPGTDDSTEPGSGTEKPDKPGKETNKKPTESETETKPTETETPATTDPIDDSLHSQYDNNQDLVANQQIVIPPQIMDSFRFITVEKVYALAAKNQVKVYTDKDEESDVAGVMSKNGLCFVLKFDEKEDWIYIESGTVRGFVKKSDLTIGDKADSYVKENKEKNLKLARATMDYLNNPALTYTKTTTGDTEVEKQYAVSKTEGLNIREGKSTEDRILGKMDKGAICYVLADADEEWIYVESDDVRGFVKSEHLKMGNAAKILVMGKADEDLTYAKELIKPEDNKVCYYTLTSTQKGTISSTIRQSMVSFAQQFVGNAYVWGGVSLTNGADCSGFVQSIYAQYGYTLPRVAEDQAQFGMKIPVEEAAPGDLIFYARDGYIHHVVMYIGDGKTVEAQSTATGIVNDGVNTGEAVWATRIISDADAANMALITNNGGQYTAADESDIGQLLGAFKLTSYCACPICCGQWSGGPTASGLMPIQGRTVAMAGVPFGTRLVINGQIFTVEDRGTPYGHVDVFLNNHQDAVNFGVQYANVYMAK